ncbi:MAG: calcium/sodium antiporter [Bacteroidales bacterium]|nr:calcium/sodium antiporter [Bacteroidales bacterium]
MDYLLLVIGLALLLAGANYLVDSAVAIAKRAKISNFIIGLTIVGIGTSAPELFVSIQSALTGHGDIAIGNVVGSNIANLLLILGVTAIICPFTIEKETHRADIPFGIFAAVILTMFVNDKWNPGIEENTLSRLDGAVLLIIFISYMVFTLFTKAKNPQEAKEDMDNDSQSTLEGKKPLLLWGIAAVSLAALLFGGQLFLDSAINLARAWGLSEAVISITIVAIGTSLPELITSVVAACKNNPQLALGNVLGSNVFNILMILGVTSSIKPINMAGLNAVDFIVMTGAAVGTFIVTYTFKKKMFDRAEGIIFVFCYIAYTAYLLMR